MKQTSYNNPAELFFDGCDVWRAGAAVVLQKELVDVTMAERDLFKVAFLAAFHVDAPRLIRSHMNDLDWLWGELNRRDLAKEFSDADKCGPSLTSVQCRS